MLSTVSAHLGDLPRLSKLLDGLKLQGKDLGGVSGVGVLRFAGGQALMYVNRRRVRLDALELELAESALATLRFSNLSVQDGDRFMVNVAHVARRSNVGGLSIEARVSAALSGPLHDPGRDP